MKKRMTGAGGAAIAVCLGLCVCALNGAAATWSGSAGSARWADTGNWDAIPSDGAALVFTNGVGTANTNDLLSQAASLTLGGVSAWDITGDASHPSLTMASGITATVNSTLNMNLALSANQTYSAAGKLLTVNGGVDLGVRQLTVNTSSTVAINGDVSGGGASTAIFCANGGATLSLNGTGNSFSGAINWGRGTLNLKSIPSAGGEITAGSTTGYGNSINYTGSGDGTTARTLRPNNNTSGYTAPMCFNNNSGSASLSFTNRSSLSLSYRNLSLGGSSAGTNLLAASYSSLSAVGITVGGSTWVLEGTNSYTGVTSVGAGGTLLVSGALAGTNAVTVAGKGRLGGAGTVAGPVSVATSGILEAGMHGAGVLNMTNSIAFASDSTNRFVGALLRVGGSVSLGNAVLACSLPGLDCRTKSLFWVIDKTSEGAVSGTFKNLPEGAAVGTWEGRTFMVTYQADYPSGQLTGGNDVALYSTSAKTVTWNGTGAESLWSDVSNWDAAPTNTANLVFSGLLRTANTNDTLTHVGGVAFTGDAPSWTIQGNALTLGGGLIAQGTGTVAWAISTTIDAACAVSVSNSLTLSGAVSGAGGIAKSGGGVLTISDANNTFSGPLTVSEGTLAFPTVSDVNGGPSALGTPADTASGIIGLSGGATLKLASAPSAQSTDRAVRLGGASGNYTIQNASSYKLTFESGFSSDATGTGSRTLYLTPNSGGIELQGSIPDLAAGLVTKLETTGAYWTSYIVRLSATNSTYSGLTTIGNGIVLEVARLAPSGEPSSIGTGTTDNRIYFTYGTSGGNYGTLRYVGTEDAVSDRPLYFNGYTSAPKTIANDSPNHAALTLSGSLSGSLAYNNFTTPIQLQGTSTAISTLAGRIIDPSTENGKRYSIVVNTSGGWALTATNTSYSGGTTVSKGLLLVNNAAGSGTGSGAVTVNAGGTLGGTGTVAGAVSVNAGGVLKAGSGGLGVLTVQNGLALAGGATNSVRIAGVHPGGYCSVRVTGGAVELGGATLSVDASAFDGLEEGTLRLIDMEGAGAVSGTFLGLPEGSLVRSGIFISRISYAGGDGNDVVLEIVPTGGNLSFQ